MPDANDMALVREYADQNSEPAFAELVHRHINLVYSVALRLVGNSQDAQDVTQAVFIILAQKAAGLRQSIILTGWLYETTRFTAMKLLRTRIRQQTREQEAYMQSTLNDATAGIWKRLAPLLEEAMARLDEGERTLLALRFFENKTGAETAVILGIREWTAHKRVNRAVKKLRMFFEKHGVVLSAEALTSSISVNSVQAAPALLAKTATAIAVAKGTAAGSSTLTLVKGALNLMAWAKAKTAVVTGAVVLLAAGTTSATITTIWRAQQPVPTASLATVAAVTPADSPGVPPNPQAPPASAATRLVLLSGPSSSPQAQPATADAAPQNPPSQPVYPNAPRMSSVMASVRSNGGGGNGIVVIPPEFYLRVQFGNLFQNLQMTPDQIAAFLKIMEEKQAQTTVVMRGHPLDPRTLTGLTDDQITAARQEHQQQIQVLLQPVNQATDLQIKQLLGTDDNFSYYQTYVAQQKERMVIMNGYRDGLDTDGVAPLTLDQDEQLVDLVYQARLSAKNDPDAEARQLPQIMQQAATFLTPDQIKVLGNYIPSLVSPPITAIGGIVAIPHPAPSH